MKNLLRLIFIITMGILLTCGECGKKIEPVVEEKPKAEEPKPDPPKPEPEPVVEEPKPV